MVFIQLQKDLYQISFYRARAYRDPTIPPLSITDSVTSHCITLTLLGSTIKLQEPETISGDTKLGTPRAQTHHWHATPKQQAPQITTTTEHKQSHLFATSWLTEARTIGVAPDGQAFRSAAMFGRSTCDRRAFGCRRRTIATPHCCVSGKPATQCVQSHC